MDFSKLQGLIPAVVQDVDSREVLMVGFMNDTAFAETRRTGYATFFSRSRNALWTKGETSGNRLAIERLLVDCDDDTVLLVNEALEKLAGEDASAAEVAKLRFFGGCFWWLDPGRGGSGVGRHRPDGQTLLGLCSCLAF